MEYRLRQATEQDYDFLYALHVATIRDAVEATWGWDEEYQRRYFEEHWDPKPRRIVVVDAQDVDMLQVEQYADHLFLALIEVAPGWQSQGLGSALIRDVQAQAQAARLPLILHVLKANKRGKQLYERLGFRIVEERWDRWVMEWGVGGGD